MPILSLSISAGSSVSGHLDPGLLMSSLNTMGANAMGRGLLMSSDLFMGSPLMDPRLVMSALNTMGSTLMRGPSAIGDLDVVTPLALISSASLSATGILVTANIAFLPNSSSSQSTNALSFITLVQPGSAASTSVTELAIVAIDQLAADAISSLSQTIGNFSVVTQLGSLASASVSQMIYALPFGAGSTLSISPISSSSTTALSVIAPLTLAPDPVNAQSMATLLATVSIAAAPDPTASTSVTQALLIAPQELSLRAVLALSTTNFSTPIASFNLNSGGLSMADMWILAPSRVITRKYRGAGARTLVLAGVDPLGD